MLLYEAAGIQEWEAGRGGHRGARQLRHFLMPGGLGVASSAGPQQQAHNSWPYTATHPGCPASASAAPRLSRPNKMAAPKCDSLRLPSELRNCLNRYPGFRPCSSVSCSQSKEQEHCRQPASTYGKQGCRATARHSMQAQGVASLVHAHRTWKVSPACHAVDSSSAVISLPFGEEVQGRLIAPTWVARSKAVRPAAMGASACILHTAQAYVAPCLQTPHPLPHAQRLGGCMQAAVSTRQHTNHRSQEPHPSSCSPLPHAQRLGGGQPERQRAAQAPPQQAQVEPQVGLRLHAAVLGCLLQQGEARAAEKTRLPTAGGRCSAASCRTGSNVAR